MKKLNVNDFKEFKDFWVLEGKNINVVFKKTLYNIFNRPPWTALIKIFNMGLMICNKSLFKNKYG